MSEMEQALRQKVEAINKDQERKKKLKDWIDGYRGKIITLAGSSASFHLVFTKGSAELRRGTYPSCEVTYRGSDASLLRLLRGEGSASSEVKAGRLKVWGSLNEAMRFEELL